eukprot:3341612-Pleurochrysis_carterae.AAC.2
MAHARFATLSNCSIEICTRQTLRTQPIVVVSNSLRSVCFFWTPSIRDGELLLPYARRSLVTHHKHSSLTLFGGLFCVHRAAHFIRRMM